MLDKPRIYLFFSATRLINLIKHEHSCKILYIRIILSLSSCADPDNSVRGGGLAMFFRFFPFSYQHISQRAVRNSLPSWGSVPEFLRKPLATCGFQGGPDPLSPPLWIHPWSLLFIQSKHKDETRTSKVFTHKKGSAITSKRLLQEEIIYSLSKVLPTVMAVPTVM